MKGDNDVCNALIADGLNLDGLVGPTHHYAGLSFGNQASTTYQHQLSNPRQAAKQGLLKMKALADLGYPQAVFPPHERPHLPSLRQLGFQGRDEAILAAAGRQAPQLLSALSSASAMWVANAATVSPAADSADGCVHFTVANLQNNFHRAIESATTARLLQAIFPPAAGFVHHQPLPAVALFGDEGAANHNRLTSDPHQPGVQLFVYGREGLGNSEAPTRYPARQTREASEAIMRLHQLDPRYTLLAQQHPAVIDQGVFHNDVIAVTHRNLLFCHQQAFLQQSQVIDTLEQMLAARGDHLQLIEVPQSAVSVTDAVSTYLFNSQLLSKQNGNMLLVVPQETQQNPTVWHYLTTLSRCGGPIDEIKVFNLRESMRNGGGPACLRLRVPLTAAQLQAVNPQVMLNDTLFQQLNQWVERYYRDRLVAADLVDPQLLYEGRCALDELTQLLALGSVYDFQRE